METVPFTKDKVASKCMEGPHRSPKQEVKLEVDSNQAVLYDIICKVKEEEEEEEDGKGHIW